MMLNHLRPILTNLVLGYLSASLSNYRQIILGFLFGSKILA